MGPDAVVAAYLDAMMGDPAGSQILIREYLDGAPFLSQLAASEPAILEPVRRTAATLSHGAAGELDPVLAVVTVGGLAALVASTRETARTFVAEPIAPDVWRRHVLDLLVHGLSPASGAARPTGRMDRDGATAR